MDEVEIERRDSRKRKQRPEVDDEDQRRRQKVEQGRKYKQGAALLRLKLAQANMQQVACFVKPDHADAGTRSTE